MSRLIKYSDVQNTLLSLGFSVATLKPSHRIFENAAKGSVVVLPFRKLSSPVDRTHLAAVRRVLIATNVVKPDAFTELFFFAPRQSHHHGLRDGNGRTKSHKNTAMAKSAS